MKMALVLATSALALGSLSIYKWLTRQRRNDCEKLMTFSPLQCCSINDIAKDLNNLMSDLLKCISDYDDYYNCNMDICFGKKYGYIDSDNKVDRIAMANSSIFDIFNPYPAIKDSIIKNCILKVTVGRPEDCQLITIRKCSQLIILANCPPRLFPNCDEDRKQAKICEGELTFY